MRLLLTCIACLFTDFALADPIVEEFDPRSRRSGFQGIDIVTHLKQVAARRAAVDDL